MLFRGNTALFTCNYTMDNTNQITWTKDRLLFSFHFLKNQTYFNSTSHRLSIDTNFPLKLNIVDVQYEDAGHYTCEVTDRKGSRTTGWNLTVFEIPKGR